ncbi:MAG TPA: tRNA pseudouridine(38-40) synthase TruA [Candidatus Enterocola sp.]|jgi:tRNA pseudouridine38-40 synthase|nr:tRNA pseudouridine(38-40) synthase TruA [Candidatus Enterocola sp.]
MPRYFIKLAYNGSNYHGWQIQPNGSSVQETIEKSMSILLGKPITIVGAGRTDAGVHAQEMIAHFNIENTIENTEELCYKLNLFLPKDIAVYSIYIVKDNMHARFSARSRTYQYFVCTSKNVFKGNMSMRVPIDTDFDTMNKAANKLFDYIDFSSFSKQHTDTKTNNCKIMQADWKQISEDTWVFTIQADRFLRNMVRAIVGTLLDVGSHKIGIDEFCHIIEQKNRCKAGTSVPAKALFLTKVEY